MNNKTNYKALLAAAVVATPMYSAFANSTSVAKAPAATRPVLLAQADDKATTTIRLDELVDGKTDWKAGIDRDASANLEVVKDQPEAGQSALRFSAEITGPRGSARLKKNLKPLNLSDIKAIRMKIKSEGATVFGIVMVDGTGQTHQKKGNKIEADGQWHDFTIDPLKVAGGEHWGGDNDGKWHGQPDSIVLTFNTGSDKVNKKPALLIANISADVVKSRAAQAPAGIMRLVSNSAKLSGTQAR